MDAIEKQIALVKDNIRLAAERSGRSINDITLIAVSKTKSTTAIKAVYNCGIRHFGENRVKELTDKSQELSDYKDINWEFIGRLQSNQCKYISKYANTFHAIDRVLIAKTLSNQLVLEKRRLKAFIQVNISGEESKAGFECDEWETNSLQKDNLIKSINEIVALPNLDILGLMTMAPLGTPASITRIIFQRAKKMMDWINTISPNYKFTDLSMGMSGDYIEAIEEGSTYVRVGSAIFT